MGIKVKKKDKKKISNTGGICSYCEEEFTLVNNKYCESCKEMFKKISRGFRI